MPTSIDISPLRESRDAFEEHLQRLHQKMEGRLEARRKNLRAVAVRPNINPLIKNEADDALKMLDAVNEAYLSLDRHFALKEQVALAQIEDFLARQHSELSTLSDTAMGLNAIGIWTSMDNRRRLAAQYLGLISQGSTGKWRKLGEVVADVATDEAAKWSGQDSIENAVKVVKAVIDTVDALNADLSSIDDVSKWLNALHQNWQQVQSWLELLEEVVSVMHAEEERWRQVSYALMQIGRDS